MQLSIIVPVYNMASDNKLNFCMDSLLNQNIHDYEIIAVDDASTDESLTILKEFEKAHPEMIRVIHYDKNKRQGGAKNEGLKVARGEWIGFIDSDDWVTPDFYENLLAKAKETGADLVGCDYNLVTEHTMTPGKIVENNSLEQTGVLTKEKHQMLILRSGSMVIKIYKHDVIKKNNLSFPEGIFYEDNCAGPLWSLYFTHYEKVKKPMYFYYQHQVSTVHHISEAKCRDRMEAADLLYQECESRGFLEEYYDEIEYRYTELYLTNTLFSYLSGVKRTKLVFIKELKRGILSKFPDFSSNKYYGEYTGEEEKRMIILLMKSESKFYIYYHMLNLYRRIRKSIGKG